MNIKLYDVQYDNVIKSYYLTTGVDYEYALDKLVPLINNVIPCELLSIKD